MKSVICFGSDNKFIISSDYQLLSCKNDQSVFDFLLDIKNRFPNSLKIIQVSFSAFHQSTFITQKKILDLPKAHVFILNEHQLLDQLPTINESEKLNLELLNFTPALKKNEFIQKVEKIKNDISQGRLYQVNLTSFLTCPYNEDNAYNLFLNLADHYNGAYKAYLPLVNCEILSFSPELFLEKKGSELRTCPIKGSLKSTGDIKTELLESEKEKAELSMIVDLLRNDLNSLSIQNSAQVIQHRAILELNYIKHTYSEIITKTDQDLPFILSKIFPGGSISGCPKLESLKLIAEIEDYDRSFYTGCIGWWKNNDFKLNLAIRSFTKQKKQLFYFAGCGVVYDSVAELEWNEFLTKAGHLNVIR